jgi:two-component system sensor histidine kinase UhpB
MESLVATAQPHRAPCLATVCRGRGSNAGMADHPIRASRAPLDLPRLLMRRAAAVALAVLALALVLGLARMGHDIDDEVDAALTLGQMLVGLVALAGPAGPGNPAQTDDPTALARLRQLAAEHPPRHLVLSVRDSAGRVLLAPPALAPASPPLALLLAWHRRLLSTPDPRQVSWQVERPGGDRWTITLATSHESERREAMANLVGTLVLLLICIAGLLLAMRWNLRLALAPLDRLLAAITGIEGRDTRAVQALPPMPVRELEAVAAALRHLAAALDEAEGRRRLLSQQLLTLQEDERARLARELHDEFGQRLTALRVDAAWLARRLAGQAEPTQVILGMAEQCQQIQRDIRSLLTRLQPFGPAELQAGGGQSLARLTDLLQALVAAWSPAAGGGEAAGGGTLCRLELRCLDDSGVAQAWPDEACSQALWLPQALALTLYRISQEALTNVVRHARARHAVLRLECSGGWRTGDARCIAWSVSDDGVGLSGLAAAQKNGAGAGADLALLALAARLRGNGLSGLRERVWAQGGELRTERGPGGLGLLLSARFEVGPTRPVVVAAP